MIKAKHNKATRAVFDVYLNRLLKKHFSGFSLIGSLPALSENCATVITPNHFSWWDGFFIDYVNTKIFKKKFYIMMLEEQLNKYWFFKKLGAFSIYPGKVSVRETINYTRSLMKDPGNLVVIYPQGNIEPLNAQNLSFNEGLKFFIDPDSETELIPAAFRIEFSENQFGDIFFKFGKKFIGKNIANNFDEYSTAFRKNIQELKDSVESKTKANINIFTVK